MTCYKTPLWDFNTDRTTSTREHLNTVTCLSLTGTAHTHQRPYRKNTRGKHTHAKYNINNIRICHQSYLRRKGKYNSQNYNLQVWKPNLYYLQDSIWPHFELLTFFVVDVSVQMSSTLTPVSDTSHGVLSHTQNPRYFYCVTGRNVPRSSGV